MGSRPRRRLSGRKVFSMIVPSHWASMLSCTKGQKDDGMLEAYEPVYPTDLSKLAEDEEAIRWDSRFEEDVRLRNCEEHVNRTSYRERYASDSELRLDYRNSKCSSCSYDFAAGIGEEREERFLDETTQRETLRELRVMRELCLALQSQLSRTALVQDTATQTQIDDVLSDEETMTQSKESKHDLLRNSTELSSKCDNLPISASSEGCDQVQYSVEPITM